MAFSLPSQITLPSALQALGAPTNTTPGSRPISFTIDDLTAPAAATPGGIGGAISLIGSALGLSGGATPPTSYSFGIPPESLTRTEINRVTVQNALGGAWVDDFGPGITQIQLSGTTGWRGFNGTDGLALFQNLHTLVMKTWNQKRQQAMSKGLDPSQVELIFADAIDGTVDVVIPTSFTLRRSKQSPLIARYDISLLVTGDNPPPAQPGFLQSLMTALGLSSLYTAIAGIAAVVTAAVGVVSAVIGAVMGAINGFLSIVSQALTFVAAFTNSNPSMVATVIGYTTAIAQAGTQVFATLGAMPGLDANDIGWCMSAYSALSDAFCVCSNVLAQSALTFPIYTGLYGASNCSSTVPGSSPQSQYTLNGTNPFYDVAGSPPPPPAMNVSQAAAQALATLNQTDFVLSPLTPPQIAALLQTIAQGISVNMSAGAS
jgi:hypothetical protein